MPTNLTEVSQFTANVPAPNDGEAANAASLLQSIQPLADRTQYLKAAVANGAVVGRRLVYAPGDGTVHTGALRVVIGEKLYSHAGGDLGVTGLASGTWYYVYAYVSAGALALEYVTTAPDGALAHKTGDTSRRYVGPFRTDGSGVPLPQTYSDGECVYRRSQISSSPSDPLCPLGTPGGSAWTTLGSWTDVAVSGLAPPAARTVALRGLLSNSSGVTTLELRTEGDSTNKWSVAYCGSGATVHFTADVELSATSKAQARMVDASSSSGQSGIVFVVGYRE